jgi:hypothetical protein
MIRSYSLLGWNWNINSNQQTWKRSWPPKFHKVRYFSVLSRSDCPSREKVCWEIVGNWIDHNWTGSRSFAAMFFSTVHYQYSWYYARAYWRYTRSTATSKPENKQKQMYMHACNCNIIVGKFYHNMPDHYISILIFWYYKMSVVFSGSSGFLHQ